MGQHQARIFFHMYIERKMQSGNDSFLDFKKEKASFHFSHFVHSFLHISKKEFYKSLTKYTCCRFWTVFWKAVLI